jgi:hypothetical protein
MTIYPTKQDYINLVKFHAEGVREAQKHMNRKDVGTIEKMNTMFNISNHRYWRNHFITSLKIARKVERN